MLYSASDSRVQRTFSVYTPAKPDSTAETSTAPTPTAADTAEPVPAATAPAAAASDNLDGTNAQIEEQGISRANFTE